VLCGVQKKDTTTSGMGAFSDIGGVLMGKQGDAAPKTVTSPPINMTVMKVDDQSGPYQLRLSLSLSLSELDMGHFFQNPTKPKPNFCTQPNLTHESFYLTQPNPSSTHGSLNNYLLTGACRTKTRYLYTYSLCLKQDLRLTF